MKKDNNLLDYVPRIPEKLNWTEDDEHRVTVDVENKGVFNALPRNVLGVRQSATLPWNSSGVSFGNK